MTFRLTNCNSKISDQNDTFQMPNSRWGLDNLVKFERAHMAPNSKPVVKVERCRQKSKPLFARPSLVYELLLGNPLNVFRHFNCILYHGRREDKKKIWVHFVWTQVKRLPSRFVERNTKVHQISSGAQCNLTVVSYQNESFPSKWELPCLPPSSLELWRRERASMQLSLWWKTLILIGHYGTFSLLLDGSEWQ